MNAPHDFAGIARQHRIWPPSLVTADADAWAAHCRAVWARFPAWAFDRDFVAELAREHLPRVLGQMNMGQFLGRISPDARRIVGRGAPFAALPRDPDGQWMMFRIEPDSTDIMALDECSHAWRCPSLDQLGNDLIDLGAWRWGISAGKAAFRIARLCGRTRPVP
jgi:hypothetical protein